MAYRGGTAIFRSVGERLAALEGFATRAATKNQRLQAQNDALQEELATQRAIRQFVEDLRSTSELA